MSAFPIVVVGGGPGGSATALALRRRGVSVVLLDAATFPRDKVCGDVLLPAAQEALTALELDLDALRRQSQSCTGCRYTTPGVPEVSGTFADVAGSAAPWWMVKRLVFDTWLLNQARSAGAEVREGWRVERLLVDERGTVTGVAARSRSGRVEEVPAAAVVGADGASSIVARHGREAHAAGGPRLADDPRHVCLAARAYATGVSLRAPYLEVFATADTLPGCAWVVPVGEGEVNLGLGLISADARRLEVTPRRLFERVREQVPALDRLLRGAEIGPWKGWTLPGASLRRPLTGPGYLLVGDAGALVDPFTGHGIHHALISGTLAGEALADAVSTETFKGYERKVAAALGREVVLGQRLQALHGRPGVVGAGLRLCARHAGLRQVFLGLVGHSAPRTDLLGGPHLLRAALTRGGAPAAGPEAKHGW